MALLDFINKNVEKIIPYSTGKPIKEVARELGIHPDELVKLASNECPLGPSPKAMKAIVDSVSNIHRYPDGAAYLLKHKLAEKLSVSMDSLIVGTGSNEILEFIGHCFMGSDSSVVMSSHSFAIYKILSIMFGSEYIEAPMKGFTHDLKAMLKAVREDTRVVFICNPNNPTSTIISQDEIDYFMDNVPDNILVVFDEAYKEIAQVELADTLRYVREGRNAIVLRSFSKSYGLAGLRVGYGVTTPEIATALNRPRQPFNLNRPAQAAAAAALDDEEFVINSKETYRKGIEFITSECRKSGIEYEQPYANFILIKVGDEQKVFHDLMSEGVIVRPLKNYDLPGYIRVTIGTEKENMKFINALNKILTR